MCHAEEEKIKQELEGKITILLHSLATFSELFGTIWGKGQVRGGPLKKTAWFRNLLP